MAWNFLARGRQHRKRDIYPERICCRFLFMFSKTSTPIRLMLDQLPYLCSIFASSFLSCTTGDRFAFCVITKASTRREQVPVGGSSGLAAAVMASPKVVVEEIRYGCIRHSTHIFSHFLVNLVTLYHSTWYRPYDWDLISNDIVILNQMTVVFWGACRWNLRFRTLLCVIGSYLNVSTLLETKLQDGDSHGFALSFLSFR